ncbi:MAG: HEAT repeat domain-containing protein [Bacteriovoracaceae bacterium]|nr:HEAT repeat domain-containing protein [Bacteriovoracaceae bacterium]
MHLKLLVPLLFVTQILCCPPTWANQTDENVTFSKTQFLSLAYNEQQCASKGNYRICAAHIPKPGSVKIFGRCGKQCTIWYRDGNNFREMAHIKFLQNNSFSTSIGFSSSARDTAIYKTFVILDKANNGEVLTLPLSVKMKAQPNQYLSPRNRQKKINDLYKDKSVDQIQKVINSSTDKREKILAINALAIKKASKSIPILIRLLDDNSMPIWSAARSVLVRLGKPAVKPLIKFLNKAKVVNSLKRAIEALGLIKDPKAYKPIVKILKNKRFVIAMSSTLVWWHWAELATRELKKLYCDTYAIKINKSRLEQS